MLKTIIIREIQEYIKSKKLLIGMLITLFLVTVTTWINIEDYVRRQQDYLDAKREMRFSLGKYHFYRKPQILSILVQGIDIKLGNRMDISDYSIPINITGYRGTKLDEERTYQSHFSSIDYTFIVKVLFSLFVIFLTYDILSKEKVNGTLKLILSNNIPRHTLLLGKYISSTIVIFSSLLLATILSLLLMVLHPSVSLGNPEFIRIFGIVLVSVIYLNVFLTISLLLSSFFDRPSSSLLFLLQLWFFLIIIYPNVGVIIAQKSIKLPTEKEVKAQKDTVSKQYENEFLKINGTVAGSQFNPESWKEYHAILNKQAESWYHIDHDYFITLCNQTHLAQNISVFSPAVHLDNVLQRYANTGMNGYDLFITDVFHYWRRNIATITSLEFTRDINVNREIKNGLPEFVSYYEKSFDNFYSTVSSILLLIFFSIIYFTLAFVIFLRKDVR